MPNISEETMQKLNEGTLILRQVLPLVDGIRHVKAIARASEIQIDLVKQCLQHLVMFGIVQVFDLFQFTNRYIAGKNLSTAICAETAFWNEVAN